MIGTEIETVTVSSAMSNSRRSDIMMLLARGISRREEIEGTIGARRLDYHTSVLEKAGLLEIDGARMRLTNLGWNALRGGIESNKAIPGFVEITEIRSLPPCKIDKKASGGDNGNGDGPPSSRMEVAEIRPLLPCIADKSKARVVARLNPPMGGSLWQLKAAFSGSSYSERTGALTVPWGKSIVTLYPSGNVSLTMISGANEAMEVLEEVARALNEGMARDSSRPSPGWAKAEAP